MRLRTFFQRLFALLALQLSLPLLGPLPPAQEGNSLSLCMYV
jgi:hypothetical protein